MHFAEQDEKREGARVVKERLAKEAEELADSTEWGPTAGRYRDLMRKWKAAGPARKDIDDELWKRFRGAQDQFFGARDAANAALDAEFAANAEVKEELLVEAEALVPVTDIETAKRAFRDIADRWDAAGKVPRERMKELEGRIRKVEQEIRGVEEEQWRRSDPEKSARADDMVAKLEAAIAEVEADLEKARAAGNEKKIKELEDNLASRQSFLDMAKRATRGLLRLKPGAQQRPEVSSPTAQSLGTRRRLVTNADFGPFRAVCDQCEPTARRRLPTPVAEEAQSRDVEAAGILTEAAQRAHLRATQDRSSA